MTPETLAQISAAAYRHMAPWSAEDFAQTLASRFALLTTGPEAFVLGQVIVDEAEILALATAPAAQGKGAATEVLTRFCQEARARGATRLFLEVAASNLPARRLYEKHGFQQTGLRRGYYTRPEGGRDDALLMSRALT